MNPWKFFDITHRDHVFCNPLSSAKVDELIALLDLPAGAPVLDIACGKGELLVRLAERYSIEGVGVDISPYCIRDAREQAAARVPVREDEFGTNADNVAAAVQAGWTPLYTLVSSEDDWDRYEALQWQAVERYAVANPGDPDFPDTLRRVWHNRDTYLRFGRQTLGWCVYLFRR